MRTRTWLAGLALLAVASSNAEERAHARRRMHPWDKLLFVMAMGLLVTWIVVDWTA